MPYNTNPQSFIDTCFDTNINRDLIRLTRILKVVNMSTVFNQFHFPQQLYTG